MSKRETIRGPFRKILVAVDGSENALKAVRTAASIAKTEHSELILLHVIVVPKDLWGDKLAGSPFVNEFWKRLKEQADQFLGSASAIAQEHGVEVTKEVLEETASTVEAISKFAEKESVDLIVVGTRGMGGFRKLLMGSVSSGLASHAGCAVLIVR